MTRSVNPKVYNRKYYLEQMNGFSVLLGKVKPFLKISKGARILDIGCGRGELAIYLVKKGYEVVGVDYSRAAINFAEKEKRKLPLKQRNKLKLIVLDAKKINFNENYFDYIISINVFEHLYPEELGIVMNKISKVLKPNGVLFVHTEPNKINQDFTYKVYIYPISTFLIKLNKIVTGRNYPGFDKNPRSELHKTVHINELNYFNFKKLFKNNKFEGKIVSLGYEKPHLSWKDVMYNIIVLWYPLSKIFPFNLLFAIAFIAIMKNKK